VTDQLADGLKERRHAPDRRVRPIREERSARCGAGPPTRCADAPGTFAGS
jgi:hypothetical protein